MGNCFKTTTHDDISLLRDSDIGESSAHIVPPPPPYQVSLVNCVKFNLTCTNEVGAWCNLRNGGMDQVKSSQWCWQT